MRDIPRGVGLPRRRPAAAAALATSVAAPPAAAQQQQQKVLRIAMTAADVPTTTGMPNNGFEGMRFLGYPVFEALVRWDLSRADRPAGLRPALAERWEQDAADPSKWRFHLRQGVQFHDGTPFNADAVVWNLDRFFRNDSPQFDPAGSAITRGRIPVLGGYRKLDDRTVEMETTRAVSYWPYLADYILMTSPQSCEQPRARLGAGRRPAAGRHRALPPDAASCRASRPSCRATTATGTPRAARSSTASCCCRCRRRIRASPRCAPARWTGSRCRRRTPSPVARGRPASRSTTGSYPHVWPWVFAAGRQAAPSADVRVRQALNYCIDRDGMVALLNGTAEPSVGFFKANDPNFGEPQNRYRLDAARGRALLAEAGYTAAAAAARQDRHLHLRLRPDAAAADERVPAAVPAARTAASTSPSRWWSGTPCSPACAPSRRQPQWLGADALNISLVLLRPLADGAVVPVVQRHAARLQRRPLAGRARSTPPSPRWRRSATRRASRPCCARRTSGWWTTRPGCGSCTT